MPFSCCLWLHLRQLLSLVINLLTKDIILVQVFSAFGFVQKITTFEKTAGFQVGNLFYCFHFWFIISSEGIHIFCLSFICHK